MSSTTLILLGAGSSSRFKTTVKKQWLYSGDSPLWLHVAEHFENSADFKQIIIVSSKDEIHLMKNFALYTYVEGGASRQASLSNALEHVDSDYVMVSDIARCCVPSDMIKRILDAKEEASCIVPVLPVTDTLYMDNTPIDREKVKIIQTPQLSVTTLLKQALETETIFTDDSSAIASLGEKVHFVEGSPLAHKLTTLSDLQKVPCIQTPSARTLTGFGIDIHAFEENKEMLLCGVKIDVDYGFKAHSDGDVAIHALITNSLIEGAYRFKDGSQQIANLLVESIKNNGGTLMNNCEVNKLEVNHGKVESAILSNGEIIEADYFIEC